MLVATSATASSFASSFSEFQSSDLLFTLDRKFPATASADSVAWIFVDGAPRTEARLLDSPEAPSNQNHEGANKKQKRYDKRSDSSPFNPSFSFCCCSMIRDPELPSDKLVVTLQHLRRKYLWCFARLELLQVS